MKGKNKLNNKKLSALKRSRLSRKSLEIENCEKKIIPILFKIIKDANGYCYNPSYKNARIVIDKNLLPRRKLNVIIEEITHSFFWNEPEYKVRKFSAQLGKIIYRLFIKK